MIKIKPYNDTSWYVYEIKKALINGHVKKENYEKHYQSIIEDFNTQLSDFGILLDDFSNSSSNNLFEEFLVASYNDLITLKQKLNCTKKNKFTDTLYKTYDKFSKNNINNKIIEKSEIKVCPYCNENFIINRDLNKTTAQLDHFFPRSQYPIFSICLYNLVPSCSACNKIKGNKNLEVSPYNLNYETNSFNFSYNPIDSNWIEDYKKLQIVFNYKNNKNGNNIKLNIDKLHIEESYKYHTDYVQEIVIKGQIYNDSTIDELLSNFPQLFQNREELIRIIFGNCINEDNFSKRPLSKLTKDILEELGITL